MKKIFASMAFLLFVVVIFVGCSKNVNPDSSKSSTQESSKTYKILVDQDSTEQKEKLEKISEYYKTADPKSYNSNVRVNSMLRDEKAHKGEKVYSLAKIIQIVDEPSDEYIYYMGYVTYAKNDREYVMLAVLKDNVYSKVLQDDEILFWASFAGSYAYTTNLGDNNTLPLLKVDMYKNVTASEEK